MNGRETRAYFGERVVTQANDARAECTMCIGEIGVYSTQFIRLVSQRGRATRSHEIRDTESASVYISLERRRYARWKVRVFRAERVKWTLIKLRSVSGRWLFPNYLRALSFTPRRLGMNHDEEGFYLC